MPPLLLGEIGSSLAQLVLVGGLALCLPAVVDPTRTAHRAALFAVAAFLALRYAVWRGTETLAPVGLTADFLASGSLFVLEMAALLGSLSAFVILSRHRNRSAEADRNAGWWGAAPPRVAILIATYNESQEVLERTIVGASSLRHPNKEILVLDDGKRDWLRWYCEARGVRYLRRPTTDGAKAGNINHALAVLAADPVTPDFVAVLDADFVPHHGFLSRSLALFHDPGLGLVQTPQHFFNADPIQHNLGLHRSYPDEQRFFFDHMQPARDGWGIAFCCGTSSVIRWQALRAIGGLPTDSVTEDFLLTLVLQEAGWSTAYLNEALTEGLAPEGLQEYVSQRARWCLGLMQIARSRLGPLGRNALRLRDRWSVADSVLFWLTTFPFRLAALVYPLLYWFFDLTVVDAAVPQVISHFGTYYLWTILVLNLISGGHVVPVVNDVSQLVGALPITRAALVGLFRPKGHPFRVTAKGGDRSRTVVQWGMMAPFLALFLLTLAGLGAGIVSDRFAYHDAGEGKLVVLFWSLYNLFVLAVAMLVCVELPRRERHVMDRPERAELQLLRGGRRRVWITDLSIDRVRVRGQAGNPGDRGGLMIEGVGEVEAWVTAATPDGAILQLLPDEAQTDALFLRFYTRDSTPGVLRSRFWAMLRDVARRLAGAGGA